MAASHTTVQTLVPFGVAQVGALFSGAAPPPLAFLLSDIYYGGLGTIRGTVEEKGTPLNAPLHRKVLLLGERSRVVLRETWSHPVTGAYRFDNLATHTTYTVLAHDYTGNYRAVIADNLTPEIL